MNQFFIRPSALVGYLVAFLVICFFAWYTYHNMQKSERVGKEEETLLTSLSALDRVLDNIQDMESAQRGYIISGNPEFLEPFSIAIDRMQLDTAELKKYSHPSIGEDSLMPLLKKKVIFMQESVLIRDQLGLEAGMARVQSDQGRKLMEDIRKIILNREEEQRVILYSYKEKRSQAAKDTSILFILLTAVFLLFVLSIFFFERQMLRRKFSRELSMGVNKGIVDFRNILDRINDGFIALDLNWNYVYVNNKAGEMMGMSPADLIGHNIWKIFPREESAGIAKAYQEAISTQKYVLYESRDQRKGTWLENHIYPSPQGLTIYFKDVTETKAAVKELSRVDEQYRNLVDNIEGIVWEAEANDFCFHFVSQQAERLLGYPVEQWINEKDFWARHLHPEDRLQALNFYLQSKKQSKPHEFEYRMIAADGRAVWLRDIVSVVIEENKPVLLRGIMVDITAQKEQEESARIAGERFNLVASATNDIIWDWDLRSDEVWWNDNFYSYFGYDKNDPPPTREKWAKGISPADKDRISSSLTDFTSNREEFWTNEYQYNKQDGSIVHIYDRAYLLFDPEGKPYRMIGSMLDITAIREAQKAVKESEEKYRTLVEQATDGIFIANSQGKLIVVNSSGCNMSQYTEDEMLKMSIYDFADPQDVKENPPRFEEMKSNNGVRSERKLKRKDGSIIDVEINAKFLSDGRFLAFVRDISQRKIAEKELRQSNERFELIGRTTNEAVWEYDFATGVAWGNTAHQALYGLGPNDPVPDHAGWCSRMHPDDRDRTIDSYHTTLQSGESVWIAEYRFFPSSGKMMNIYDRTYIVRDKEGKPVRMMGSMTDITQRKTAELEMIKARELAEKMIDSLPGVFYFYDINGKFIRWNKQFEIVTGYSTEEFAQLHPTDLFEGDEKTYIMKRIEKVFETGSNDAEAHIVTKIGERIPYYFKAVKIIYEGETCLLGSGIDLTDRKKAEEELRISEKNYRSLVEQAADAIIIFNKEGNLVDANSVATQLLNYSKEEFLSLQLEDIHFPEDLIANPIQFEPLTAGESVIKRRNFRRKDGSSVTGEVHSKMLPDGRYLGMIRDLTERIIAEQRLEESFRSIRELTEHLQNIREEERSHIAREIHDELGQQLTVLKMDVAWLNKKMGDAEEPVGRKLRSLTDLLDGTVKTVRRISSELRPSLLDDLGLVAAIDWHLREFEKRSGLETEFSDKGDDISMPESIKTGLFRIFQESLTNVARHAEASKVKVNLHRQDGILVLSIQDDGRGFNGFQTGDKKTLGILGMRERTSMMGGTYDIKSQPGKGTVVKVSVPIIS